MGIIIVAEPAFLLLPLPAESDVFMPLLLLLGMMACDAATADKTHDEARANSFGQVARSARFAIALGYQTNAFGYQIVHMIVSNDKVFKLYTHRSEND